MHDLEQTIRELRDPQFVYHFSRDYLKNMMDDAAESIKELLAKNKRLEEKVVELQAIADHYEGCAQEWYQMACDYKNAAPNWISVEEKLPDDHVRVLLCNDEGKMVTGERAEDDWWYCYCAYDVDRWDEKEQGRVVAWMPLPYPQKEV